MQGYFDARLPSSWLMSAACWVGPRGKKWHKSSEDWQTCSRNRYAIQLESLLVMCSSVMHTPFQLEDEPLHLNIYQPQRVLLASVQLRLAHLSTLLAASSLDPAQRMEHTTAARRASEEGREVLRESVRGDPCLAAELAFHYGKIPSRHQY